METVATDHESADRDASSVDPETARERIRERGETIREQELARALRRLQARRTLSEREREVIGELARRLTDELLSVPETHLRAVESEGEPDGTTRVAVELFGEE